MLPTLLTLDLLLTTLLKALTSNVICSSASNIIVVTPLKYLYVPTDIPHIINSINIPI